VFPNIAAILNIKKELHGQSSCLEDKAPTVNKRESPGRKGVITKPVSEKIMKKRTT
jgi:hypothetical protein